MRELFYPRAARGQVVLVALVFFSICIAITAALISLLTTSERAERIRIAKAQAVNLAEAGFDHAVYQLNQGGSYTGETGTVLGAGAFTTTVTSLDGGTKKIMVTASVPAANPITTKTVSGKVAINTTTVSFRFGVQVGAGGLTMDNNSEINGNLTSVGNVSGSGVIDGDAIVAGGTSATPDQERAVQNCGTNLGDTNARANLAQSFTPSSSAALNSVSLYVKKVGTPSDITIKIVSDSGGSPSKTVLASGTLGASGVGSSYAFISGSLTATPLLTGGTKYWVIAIASVSSSNYFVWGADTADAYTGGTGKSSNNWNAGNPSWAALGDDLDFRAYMGGVDTYLDGVEVTGSARAHTLTSCEIGEDAYYASTNTCSVGGTSYPGSPDEAPASLPITEAQIDDWESVAESGGTIAGPYTISTPQTLGPKKVVGDLTINSTLTLSGPVWVDGNITFNNGSTLTVAGSIGNSGAVLLADAANPATGGVIMVNNGTTFSGNGSAGSYPMVLSTNTSDEAITLENGSSNAIVYSSAGGILVNQNASANQITGYKLHLNENAIVNYVNGLASQSFANGPGGSWSFVPGSYGISP